MLIFHKYKVGEIKVFKICISCLSKQLGETSFKYAQHDL
jgi:hypothetical protein